MDNNKQTKQAPVRPTSRFRLEAMLTTLREEIVNGTRQIGSFLPSLPELGAEYSLSKNTLRKGLEVLVQEGLIENIPRIGAKVIANSSTSVTTIKFGYYQSLLNEAKILHLIDQFHQQQPNIRVVPIRINDPAKLQKSALEDLLPNLDLLTINLTDYDQLPNKEQLLEPLNLSDDVYSFLQEPFLKDDCLYVQPFIFSPLVLCYNKEHLREKHVPEPNSSWTWEDVQRWGRALSEPPGRYGLFFHVPSENRWPIFLMQNNFSFRPNDAYTSLDDPLFRQSFEQYNRLIQDDQLFPNYFSENDADVETLFLNEKVSMIIASYLRLNAISEAAFEYDISPLPYLNDPKTLLIIIGLAVSKASDQKPAVKMLYDFLMSYDSQLYIRQQTLSIPALASAAEWSGKEKLKNRPSRFSMYREIIPTFSTYKELNIASELLMLIREELKLYWAKMVSWEAVVERIKLKIKAQLEAHDSKS